MGEPNRLREYRLRRGLTQAQVVDEIYKLGVARGEKPGLCPVAVSRHENWRASWHKRPGPYYQALYGEVYRATPAELGFPVALPGESGHPEEVDRREFLMEAAGFMVALALPAPTRLGSSDIASLRDCIIHLYRLDDIHGAGAVYPATMQTFQRLRTFVEHASYNQATGQALRELTGLTAEHAGWLAFDANRDDDAQRWWLEALKWGRRAESDSVSVVALASMCLQASDQRRPREVVDLATTARSTARRSATPRLISDLLAHEALGHAGQGDATSAHTALRRAREHTETHHDDDPAWLTFYGPADFAWQEHRVALMLGDFNAAEDAARTALAMNDHIAYPRNHALYLVHLADILVQRREIDEATAVAKQASVAAAGLNSPRVTRELHSVTQSLAAA